MIKERLRLEKIPLIDSQPGDSIKEQDVEITHRALQDIGFMFFKMPDLYYFIRDTAYPTFGQFYSQPWNVKKLLKHEEIGHQRGYTEPFIEASLRCNTPHGVFPDCKEIMSGGKMPVPGSKSLIEFPDMYLPNIWPENIPNFGVYFEQIYDRLFEYGLHLLQIIALSMGKDQHYFDSALIDPICLMRSLCYPATKFLDLISPSGKYTPNCMHTDINLITMLPASTRSCAEGGLWVRRADGNWIPGSAVENNVPEGYGLVQVGDMLSYLTNGMYHSAEHRVDDTPGGSIKSRLSVALFMHANPGHFYTPEWQWQKAYTHKPYLNRPISEMKLLFDRLLAIKLADQKLYNQVAQRYPHLFAA